MIIDFHTHAFPDALAGKAMAVLTKSVENVYIPVSNGTVDGLLKNMDAWGVDISVIQPVITKQSQVINTNEWVRSICSDRIVGFGGIYPHTDDYKRDIDYVVSLGLKGLKFHAEYQDFVLDDSHMLKIYDYALSRDLILLHHAGVDPGMPTPYKTCPKQFAHVIREMQGGIIVAAHFGGHAQWDDVEKYLAGTEIYLDTSMGFEYYSQEQFLRIASLHGTDKILFASDAPWSNAGNEIEKLKSMPIPDNEKAAILGRNAAFILKLSLNAD